MIRRIVLVLLLTLSLGTLAATAQTYKPHTFEKSWKDRAGELLYDDRNYKAAIETYRKWLEASPLDNISWYNLACAYALDGQKEGAIDAFERAIDAGYTDAPHARTDGDLSTIKDDPRFEAALKRIDERKAAMGPNGYIRRFSPMQTVGTYIVALPPDYATSGKEYPICLILHGNGSSELRHGSLADSMGRDGVIYVAPRAPYPNIDVMQQGGIGWTAWMSEDIDENDPAFNAVPRDYVEWIFNCVHDVQSNYRAQKGKIFIYGHSQGAYFAHLCALAHPDEVRSYLAHAGRMPAPPFNTPAGLARMKEEGVRALLVHGESDAVVQPEESKKYAEALKSAGVSYALKLLPGDHGFSREIREAIKGWIASEVRASSQNRPGSK